MAPPRVCSQDRVSWVSSAASTATQEPYSSLWTGGTSAWPKSWAVKLTWAALAGTAATSAAAARQRTGRAERYGMSGLLA